MTEKQKKPSKVVHYIIVVHGIGQQRKNETVLPVIGQFVAARHDDPAQVDLLSLGQLTSQSREKAWIEYQAIPSFLDPSLKEKPWIPKIADGLKGENLRFVDFCWSGVTRKQHAKVGETTKIWTQSLINRLGLRVKLEKKIIGEKDEKPSTQWMVDMMKTLQEGVLFVEKIMNLHLPAISNEIFGEFLGDVEMYGDFPHTRGHAVRLFHETMAKVHRAHCEEFGNKVTPQYTIIAHSLGTVLTMDAIAYAHANIKSRSGIISDGVSEIVHFPGYNESLLSDKAYPPENKKASDNIPEIDWVEYLCSYVTLGSPIDKYLALWPENYFHFNNTEWMNEKLIDKRKQNKIRHFNYADEQDPVGHELNVLKTTPAWTVLAEIPEDIIFTRYAYPGKAHVDYWKDSKLFSRILELCVDKRDQPLPQVNTQQKKEKGHEKQKIKWFKLNVYLKSLFISYIAIPSIGWLIATISLNTVASSLLKNYLTDFPVMAFITFLITLYLTHILMKLLIEWHVVLGLSRKREGTPKEKKERKTAQDCLRIIITWFPAVWGLLFLGLLFFDISPFLPELLLPLLLLLKVGLSLAFLVSFDISTIYRRINRKWANNIIETDFKKICEPISKII